VSANNLKWNNGSSAYTTGFVNGDIVGIAFDADAGTLTFYRNGSSLGTAFTGIPAGTYFAGAGVYSPTTVSILNFGQRPFAYTAPSGFKALNTANLPAPLVTKPSDVMDVLLWTGNGSSPRSFSGLSFSPDLAWMKQRSSTADHALIDTVRGPAGNSVSSNTTDAESNIGLTVNSFDSGGFTLATGSFNFSYANTNGQTYAAWCWDAGTTTTTNTQGSISSQVRANASAGFSIVTWTGSGAVGTIGHGLNVKPGFIVVKSRTNTEIWYCYHSALGAGQRIQLNETSAAVSSVVWNSTEPTSSVFSITSSQPNTSGQNYVAYCWAPLTGYSSFGSYVGNGSSDGVFVYTGFRPKWILFKRTNSTGVWGVWDTARNTYNAATSRLQAESSSAELNQAATTIDILSNGFKPRTGDSDINASGSTYIYFAVAESPFQYARAR
jgi:hypothetical protein